MAIDYFSCKITLNQKGNLLAAADDSGEIKVMSYDYLHRDMILIWICLCKCRLGLEKCRYPCQGYVPDEMIVCFYLKFSNYNRTCMYHPKKLAEKLRIMAKTYRECRMIVEYVRGCHGGFVHVQLYHTVPLYTPRFHFGEWIIYLLFTLHLFHTLLIGS